MSVQIKKKNESQIYTQPVSWGIREIHTKMNFK